MEKKIEIGKIDRPFDVGAAPRRQAFQRLSRFRIARKSLKNTLELQSAFSSLRFKDFSTEESLAHYLLLNFCIVVIAVSSIFSTSTKLKATTVMDSNDASIIIPLNKLIEKNTAKLDLCKIKVYVR
jgi:hypothetical protein